MCYKKIFIRMFWVLAILNIADMIFTGVGLHYGFFDEKNPLMKSLWEMSPAYFYIVKTLLSAGIILLIQLGLKKITPSLFTVSLAGVAVVMYTSVMIIHGYAYHFTFFQ